MPNELSVPAPPWIVRLFKCVGSIFILLHLIAVVIAPASVPPTPTTVTKTFYVFRPYLQFAYLNHGYHYFAPDPGPSSLMEYTILDPENRRWARFPNRNKHWPRLLYHRYFMLTEFYAGIHPNEAELRKTVAAAYARQIARSEKAETAWVSLTHVTHNLSTREEIIQGGKLTALSKYDLVPLGRFRIESSVSEAAESLEPNRDHKTVSNDNLVSEPSNHPPTIAPVSEISSPAADLLKVDG